MKLLVNLMGFTKGGAQQVGVNFVSIINEINIDNVEIYFYVAEGTLISELLKDNKKTKIVKNNIISRIFHERLLMHFFVKKNNIDVVYCLFGLKTNVEVPCIIGSALSNLYFPEINFWKNYSPLKRMIKLVKDKYRLIYTLKANAIIFENESMRIRAIELFRYPKNRTAFIKPSISKNSENQSINSIRERCKLLPSGFKILMLTGWHKNKNIDKVPEILFELLKERKDYYFIISVSKNDKQSIKLLNNAKKMGVDKNIIFFDTVKPFEVRSLIESVNIVALLSLLESFSNNIIEAWSYKKPLLISDEVWSRSICNDAAMYCERDNPVDIANKILELRKSKEKYNNLIEKGSNELKSYPDPYQKVKLQIDFIKKIYNEQKS